MTRKSSARRSWNSSPQDRWVPLMPMIRSRGSPSPRSTQWRSWPLTVAVGMRGSLDPDGEAQLRRVVLLDVLGVALLERGEPHAEQPDGANGRVRPEEVEDDGQHDIGVVRALLDRPCAGHRGPVVEADLDRDVAPRHLLLAQALAQPLRQ